MWLINSMPSGMKAFLCFACVVLITSILIWLLNPVIIPVLVSLVLYVCLLPLHDWLTNLTGSLTWVGAATCRPWPYYC